jgi:EAL domain-containing protein (putative c-di-GMP-specific phosphodiesterase class I)
LIEDIDRWVLNRIFDHLQYHPNKEQRFAVNLSGNTISDEGLKDFIINKFKSTGVSPQRLQFEVTETAAIRHFDRAMDFINALKDLGCYFSLDDFGSGLSSLGYLKELPVDYLKIDGSFIRGIATNPDNQVLTQALVSVAKHFDMYTVAEFVETEADAQYLSSIGIDCMQGHYFGAATIDPAWQTKETRRKAS